MTKPPEVIKYWIDTINTEAKELSKWEENFMESVTEQFELWKSISNRQEEILERLYTEKTS